MKILRKICLKIVFGQCSFCYFMVGLDFIWCLKRCFQKLNILKDSFYIMMLLYEYFTPMYNVYV